MRDFLRARRKTTGSRRLVWPAFRDRLLEKRQHLVLPRALRFAGVNLSHRRSDAQEAFDDVVRPSRTLRAAVTDLQAASELVLLSVFKGRRDQVDAILEPDAKPRGPRKKKDPGPT